MNIAETIYQHVKIMPTAKALEVLQFIAFIETKNNLMKMQNLTMMCLNLYKNCPFPKKI